MEEPGRMNRPEGTEEPGRIGKPEGTEEPGRMEKRKERKNREG